ncbi:hypothetical protein ACQKJ1_19865 [Methylorubrum rhodesianum]|uniref:hypothetical protein n=1 Tax=Methylorubrum rhodesianum TaxID=29427 RepID=UPI003D0097D2
MLRAAIGFAHFVQMVTPEAGASLVARVRALAERGTARVPSARPRVSDFRARAARGVAPLPRWWDPAARPAPEPDPVLVQAAAEAAASARHAMPSGRSFVPVIGRSSASLSVDPTPAPQDDPETVPMKPWMVALGVFVLFQAGAVVHPVLGLLVLAGALAIGLRRWLRGRRNR